MATIPTLDGPLDTAQLGTVLMHEHIFNLTAEIQLVHPGFNGWDPEVQVPKAQEQLRAVKEAGIDTIVELSPIGLGRSLDLIRRAAEGSGLNLVLATGSTPTTSCRGRGTSPARGRCSTARSRSTRSCAPT